MSFSIEFADETNQYEARIKVVGVGGSGGNAVNTMINFGLEGVEFIVVNTDAQALNSNAAPTKLNIGSNVTKGLGAGADPEVTAVRITAPRAARFRPSIRRLTIYICAAFFT